MATTWIPFKPKNSTSLITLNGDTFYSKYFTGITLYQCSAEDRRVDKSGYLVEVANLDGALRESTDILNPSIMFEIEGLPKFNYAYIPMFNRYYFVENITSVRQNLWQVDFSVDTLYTYRNEIRNLQAFVERNEFNYNTNLVDSMLPFSNEPIIERIVDYTHSPFNIRNNVIDDEDTVYRYVLCGYMVENILAQKNNSVFDVNFTSNNVSILNGKKTNSLIKQFLGNAIGSSALDVLNIFANNPLDGVISITAYPIDLKSYLKLDDSQLDEILIGNYITAVTGYQASSNIADNSLSLVASFDLTNKGDKWYDYDTNITIYLPYAGLCQLNTSLCLGNIIDVMLNIDFNSGNGIYYIYSNDGDDYQLIHTVNCVVGTQIPLSSTASNERLRNRTLSAIDFALSMSPKTVVAHTAQTVVTKTKPITKKITHSPLIGANGKPLNTTVQEIRGKQPNISSIRSSDTTYEKTFQGSPSISAVKGIADSMVPSITYQGSFGGEGWLSVRAPQFCELRLIKPNPIISANYGSLYGYPLEQYTVLGALEGFTKCGEVHIDNLSTATSEEKSDIEVHLTNGVIL